MNSSRFRNKLIWLSVFTLIVVLFRGPGFRFFIGYKSIGERAQYSITNQRLENLIRSECKLKDSDHIEIQSLIKNALKFTTQQLQFTDEKCDLDPNKLLSSHRTNCIGYSAFFSTTLVSLLQKYHLSDKFAIRHHVGQLYLFDFNIHTLFSKPFFKNHDFVTIENVMTGEMIAVDPSMSDYFYIDFVKIKN